MAEAIAGRVQLWMRWVKFLVVLTHIMQAMVAMATAEEAMGEVGTCEVVK